MNRQDFRAHALDGAQLYFQPASGVHVRVATAATATLRRRAPRVVMFGVTNACNLACAFCSRDTTRQSAWTVETAAAALRGLHDAGTLEVAYGGGEPFAFRGFAELVAELDATTTLAQHVTTNGTLLHDAMWARYAGRFGVVRLSIHDGTPWRPAADTLRGHGQRWGANVLVRRLDLDRLPALLAELGAAGCDDVSWLSYVGPDAGLHLDAADDRRLSEIVAASPLRSRASVCFGDRLSVPRLFSGDCGAGRDFLSITPDRRVQSCSFQEISLPGATADEILEAWRAQQPALLGPTSRRGCARALPLAAQPSPPSPPPISIWRSFSGNNSGECFLVARFHDVADAERYLAELSPGFHPGEPHSPEWRALFTEQQVGVAPTEGDHLDAPRELLAIGRTVLAVQYDAGDALRHLRALAWKRGAAVVPGGVHVHEDVTLLAAVRCRDDRDRDDVLTTPWAPGARRHAHGDVVFVSLPVLGHESPVPTLAAARDALLTLSAGRPLAVELFFDEVLEAALLAAKRHLGHAPSQRQRLSIVFWGEDRHARAARMLQLCGAQRTTVCDSLLLVDPAPDRKRLAVLAYRMGGSVAALDGEELELGVSVWFDPPPVKKGRRPAPRGVDVRDLEARLRAALPRASTMTIVKPDRPWRPGADVTVRTTLPGPALDALGASVAAIGAQHYPWVRDVDPIGAALRRLRDDVVGGSGPGRQ
ncbi:MAG: radical SAM protein [Polyangiaceae bacterium]|nr:radical SAM protein [Polyangiaceae bacterium]